MRSAKKPIKLRLPAISDCSIWRQFPPQTPIYIRHRAKQYRLASSCPGWLLFSPKFSKIFLSVRLGARMVPRNHGERQYLNCPCFEMGYSGSFLWPLGRHLALFLLGTSLLRTSPLENRGAVPGRGSGPSSKLIRRLGAMPGFEQATAEFSFQNVSSRNGNKN
jgi:hypothetical protein